jgi:hypothetical protein
MCVSVFQVALGDIALALAFELPEFVIMQKNGIFFNMEEVSANL